jgi:hypothetical protein
MSRNRDGRALIIHPAHSIPLETDESCLSDSMVVSFD